MAKLARPLGKRNIPLAEDKNAPKPLEVKSVVEGQDISDIPSVEKTERSEEVKKTERSEVKKTEVKKTERNISEAELREEFDKALLELNMAAEGMPETEGVEVKTARVKVSVPVKEKEKADDTIIRQTLIGLLKSDPEIRNLILSFIEKTERSEAGEETKKDDKNEKDEKWRNRMAPLRKGMPLEDEIINWLEERGVPGISLTFDEVLYSKDEDAGAVNVVWLKDSKPVSQVRVPLDELFREYR